LVVNNSYLKKINSVKIDIKMGDLKKRFVNKQIMESGNEIRKK